MAEKNKALSIEEQVFLMRKYIIFSKNTKRMKKFLTYTGYFRASRYGKFLISNTNVLGGKPKQDLLFNIYDFDMKLREVLMRYCKRAEIQFKSHLSNSISIKTGNPIFYIDEEYYTPSKSENNKKKKQMSKNKYIKFEEDIIKKERELRYNSIKYPELKEYRKGGKKSGYEIPSWVAFSYFDFGTVTYVYKYLKGDLRKEVLKYGYSKKRYGKEVTKQMDTWLDAIRNLRNICAHHNLLVGKTSSVVLFSSEDDDVTSALNNTDLFSRLYALKKVLNSDDSKLLKKDLNKIIMRSKIDIFKLNILPENWEDIYDSINLL